jgi:hypothetical protein
MKKMMITICLFLIGAQPVFASLTLAEQSQLDDCAEQFGIRKKSELGEGSGLKSR